MGWSEAVLWWLPSVAVIAMAIIAVVIAERRRRWLVLGAGAVAVAATVWQQQASQAHRRDEAAQLRDLSGRLEALTQPSPASGSSAGTEAAAAAGAEVASLQGKVKGLEDQIATLREHYRNRTIDASQAAGLTEALRPFAGTVAVVSCAPGDVEAYSYADRLATVLRGAGWDARGPETTQIFGNAPAMAVAVYVPEGRPADPAKGLIDAFTKAGVPVQGGIPPNEGIPNPAALELYVAKKP